MSDKLIQDAVSKTGDVLAKFSPRLGSSKRKIPFWFHMIFGALTCAMLIPPVLAFRARTQQSPARPVHLFRDMDQQPKFKAQAGSELFRDGRAMRQPVEGTIARGELRDDDHYFLGKNGDQWAVGLPARVTIDDELLARGEERYGVFCAPCHGVDGAGAGPVHLRAETTIAAGTAWVQPSNLHEAGADRPLRQPDGQIYNTIANGLRNMMGYADQIPVEDRWAIVAHVRVLQRSQTPRAGDIPADIATQLDQNPNQIIPADRAEK